MSRRHRAEKRERIPDSRYKSTLVSHLINMVMKDGKIIEQGNHASLLAKGGFYTHLYNSQFAGASVSDPQP